MVTPSMWRNRKQEYQMALDLLAVLSTLFTGIGMGSLVNESLFPFMKSQSMQEMSAPLSTRAQVLRVHHMFFLL